VPVAWGAAAFFSAASRSRPVSALACRARNGLSTPEVFLAIRPGAIAAVFSLNQSISRRHLHAATGEVRALPPPWPPARSPRNAEPQRRPPGLPPERQQNEPETLPASPQSKNYQTNPGSIQATHSKRLPKREAAPIQASDPPANPLKPAAKAGDEWWEPAG